jgi:hypothetical protein
MSAASRFMLKFENDNVDAINYQEFGIELGCDVDELGLANVAAQLIAYASGACRWTSDQHTKLVGIQYTPTLSTLSVPVAFPTAEYAALYAATVGDYPKIVGITNYGQDLGETGNPLAPLGTSIVVSEYTATGGPAGRGRHFLPFTGAFSVTGGGFVQPTHRAGVEALYVAFILGQSPDTVIPQQLQPVVENAAGTTVKNVLNVKAQPVFSNLKSRRR